MGEAQGKKVALPPLRPGDRGAAVLWPDQAIEAAWLAGPAALKEKTWRISTETHKRQASPGEEKETRACRLADTAGLDRTAQTASGLCRMRSDEMPSEYFRTTPRSRAEIRELLEATDAKPNRL
jgi:hypothetical protein